MGNKRNGIKEGKKKHTYIHTYKRSEGGTLGREEEGVRGGRYKGKEME